MFASANVCHEKMANYTAIAAKLRKGQLRTTFVKIGKYSCYISDLSSEKSNTEGWHESEKTCQSSLTSVEEASECGRLIYQGLFIWRKLFVVSRGEYGTSSISTNMSPRCPTDFCKRGKEDHTGQIFMVEVCCVCLTRYFLVKEEACGNRSLTRKGIESSGEDEVVGGRHEESSAEEEIEGSQSDGRKDDDDDESSGEVGEIQGPHEEDEESGEEEKERMGGQSEDGNIRRQHEEEGSGEDEKKMTESQSVSTNGTGRSGGEGNEFEESIFLSGNGTEEKVSYVAEGSGPLDGMSVDEKEKSSRNVSELKDEEERGLGKVMNVSLNLEGGKKNKFGDIDNIKDAFFAIPPLWIMVTACLFLVLLGACATVLVVTIMYSNKNITTCACHVSA